MEHFPNSKNEHTGVFTSCSFVFFPPFFGFVSVIRVEDLSSDRRLHRVHSTTLCHMRFQTWRKEKVGDMCARHRTFLNPSMNIIQYSNNPAFTFARNTDSYLLSLITIIL